MGVSLTKCLELSLACSKAFRRSWLQWSFFFFGLYLALGQRQMEIKAGWGNQGIHVLVGGLLVPSLKQSPSKGGHLSRQVSWHARSPWFHLPVLEALSAGVALGPPGLLGAFTG